MYREDHLSLKLQISYSLFKVTEVNKMHNWVIFVFLIPLERTHNIRLRKDINFNL
ncbi:hypothetical protein SAMN05443633_104333 [Chryseobacterium arachidis]|uniref:Uncharacterized protein n=1 Tax=Chryseobacterium arachidis TaxID=1416778 RepID=A0A1M5BY73_9FLAO|nr:hypothetical protein SAMN05443633_104333 [Chryseobacterium arachidis]